MLSRGETESTPNADALKFLPNYRVLPEGLPTPFVEYLNPRATISPPHPSPLAARLMAIDGVTAVFYGADFITVTKAADAHWAHIRPEVFALITEAITSGQQLVTVSLNKVGEHDADGEHDGQVVATDSLSYDENDSEVVEGMLMHYIEEVKGVHQVMDQEEEVAIQEFAKFEERLKQHKEPRHCCEEARSTSNISTK
ncbi:hypothetical protein P8C59_006303 [Phyllachora maydis]|uniref:Scaffold protein Nfu/NifU N-terminal domain-containing protein n=1 Tax=Phyllachora maydis TaxID=1825666 RepID=A0AAD9I690_9PEZI|nr:hypothetical protein P8C59_006303 [Phyllachora maydis]